MKQKYKDNKCKNCGNPCWRSSKVCGLCFEVVFRHNRNHCYDNYLKEINGYQDAKAVF